VLLLKNQDYFGNNAIRRRKVSFDWIFQKAPGAGRRLAGTAKIPILFLPPVKMA